MSIWAFTLPVALLCCGSKIVIPVYYKLRLFFEVLSLVLLIIIKLNFCN